LDFEYNDCTFNLKDELILFGGDSLLYRDEYTIVFVYSTQNKNNKWNCKKIYEIPEELELICMSKYDELYLYSNNYIYKWNLITKKSVKLFGYKEMKDNNMHNKVINILFVSERFTIIYN